MSKFVEWHDRTLADHQRLTHHHYARGYRMLSVTIYGGIPDTRFAAVMARPVSRITQTFHFTLTNAGLLAAVTAESNHGRYPVMVAATGVTGSALFTAVFQKTAQPTTLVLIPPTAPPGQTLPDLNSDNAANGQIIVWAASWGAAPNRSFLGIWTANPSSTLWGNQGLYESEGDYRARLDAETSVWCRPAFVTLNDASEFLSVFVANDVGSWWASHAMTVSRYRKALRKQAKRGLVPICVQAAAAPFTPATFSAIFARTNIPKKRHFSSHGPIAHRGIDNAVRDVMAAYPEVRHATLGIVKGVELVYARGYTMAERSWPKATDTTLFRLASVSKTVTALAIFQQIGNGNLSLSDTMQSILGLTTPSGGPPADGNFANITIQQLLEHTSGLVPDAQNDGVDAAAAWHTTLPMTQDQMDSYIASLLLQSVPGSTQAYSNCGYYMLGRIVAKLAGTTSPIAAYKKNFLAGLGITRIRHSVDLVRKQRRHEARYQATDLNVFPSQQSRNQPLVADGYGNYQLAIGQGGSGLSAAAPDLARLVAVFLNPNNSPGFLQATLAEMLNRAATLSLTQSRAGYGFDFVTTSRAPPFYAQKGGEIDDCASVLQFDGEWGFVLMFGSPAQEDIQPPLPSWYPDFQAGMNIAQTVNWRQDLFSTVYEMPPI
ncbi:MAG: serine hydrolase [Burkholderiaceae bacterium]|jgi:CubicO group peptidase (beta-lactamase class C family)